MPIDYKLEAAWAECSFCAQSDEKILRIIKTPDRWSKLPLGYLCAWHRICQVAFRCGVPKKPDRLWAELCACRADENNLPSDGWKGSDWMEGWCQTYADMNTSPAELAEKALRMEALEPAGWRAGFRLEGTVVTSVDVDSPAYHAGLREGDRFVRAGGVDVSENAHVFSILKPMKRGDTTTLIVERQNTEAAIELNRPSFQPSRPW